MDNDARSDELSRQVLCWLQEARGGSQEALGRLLDTYRQYLLRVAHRQIAPALLPKGGPSDVVQDALLDAHRHFDDFRGVSAVELLGWLDRILRNRLAKFARSYRTRKRSLAREQPEAAGGSDAGGDAGPAADEALVQREQAEAVRQALDRLPELYRLVIEMRHRDQRPFDEIAQQTGRTEAAVRKVWARGLERLRRELEEPDDLAP
jgi:RNA polymerase sigma-70 factor (ECF subfamily)